ncbi:helix-turn-helix transcriptional regulator [Eubacterium sp. 1001713B170207_170306_E7]|uniref:helix-turn-helix domain-containing protein n=1 Tax=Eubacterium sp. 1001713B170207_170306_E7 TaxID=2787097 RepID=UPI00189A1FBC|nr:helix-turn-helix transcriptional regulator [Eubacterium sp. 1001713B170207_170306_E7]
MSQFSERLTTLVEATGFSIYQLSKKAKIDRSTIHKVMVGERMPSADFYKKLCRALSLTPFEKRELDDLYKMARIGDKVYYRRNSVKRLVEELAGNTYAPSEDISGREYKAFPVLARGTQVIEGKNDINSVLIDVINDEIYHREAPHLAVALAFDHQFVYEYLYNAFVSAAGPVDIDHFIYLDKETSRNDAIQKNLRHLQYILSFSLCGRDGYHPYYSYVNADPAQAVTTFLPYFIITSRHVLKLSRSFKTAVLYDDEAIVSFYKASVERLCRGLPQLTRRANRIEDMYGWTRENLGDASLEPHPCLSLCLNAARIERLVQPDLPGREAVCAMAEEVYGPYVRRELPLPRSIFSPEGLNIFAETGRICYFPETVVRCCTPEERKAFLREILDAVESGETAFMAVDSDKFRIPLNVEIIKAAEQQIVVQRFSDDSRRLNAIFIDEPGICEAFSDFFDYLPDSDLTLDREGLINLLKSYL